MFQAHCTYPAPVLSLLVMSETQIWALEVFIASGVSWLLGPLVDRAKPSLCDMCLHPCHMDTRACIHVT